MDALLPPLLLLLAATLTSSHFHPGGLVDAQASSFIIQDITLSIEPATNVTRGTNVTVRCRAVVSTSGQETLSREYTIYKDGIKIYTKTSSSPEDLEYPLPNARVSNTGKYMCEINIRGKQDTSKAQKLTVTGLSLPELYLNSTKVLEGEELTLGCAAPGETGSIIFYFYQDSEEVMEKRVTSKRAEVRLRLSSVGNHRMHCEYTVIMTPDSIKSKKSNTVDVSVRELSIMPVLATSPADGVFEGDRLDISCTINNSLPSMTAAALYLSQGTRLLSTGVSRVNHSMVALAKDSGELECRLEMGKVVKVATKVLSVTELFSTPTLSMSPAKVFQRESMTLTCESESFASERLSRAELTYTLDPPSSPLTSGGAGVFSGKALLYDFNYTCVARARGIEKRSRVLTVHPRVYASQPKISVEERPVLGRPFEVQCQSDFGSPPINYTLIRGYTRLSTISVTEPVAAVFMATIHQPEEISKYMCEAANGHEVPPLSKRLSTAVTVPLSNPTLTVIPDLPEIAEGDHLILICGVKGTPPVTFKWYRVGTDEPLFTTTSDKNNSDYQVAKLAKKDSGAYFCEAFNHANNVVRSGQVAVEVRLAMWKKAVIGGFCLLAAAVLVLVLVLCFRSKRAVVDRATISVWSERPPEAADDEMSSVASHELDVEYTEVVHPQPVDPARVPLKKGTDTVYSELQNSPHGAGDHHGYASVEYAELNGEQPEVNHQHPEVNDYQDLPPPVD